jgi:hypothetical protein
MKCCFSEKGNPSFKIGAANVKEVETMSVERVLLALGIPISQEAE